MITITIQELHEYAKEKVQAAKPVMKPEFYPHKEGFNIVLTYSPVNDPELEYRREVEKWVKRSRGKISSVGRRTLHRLASRLGLSSEVAQRIQTEILAPYEQRKAHLQEYEEALKEALAEESPLSDITREELKDFQEVLGLRDEDVASIEARLLSNQVPREVMPEPEQLEAQSRTVEVQPEVSADDLSSDKGVDYTKLRDLLAQGKWKEADEETLTVMIEVAGREKDGGLRLEDIEKFSCTDLRTIDTLWVKYSNGRFGFSVQKRIWESVGGTPDVDWETYECFSDRVGWRVNNDWLNYNNLTFTLEAAKGHLPFGGDWDVWNVGGVGGSLLSRRDL